MILEGLSLHCDAGILEFVLGEASGVVCWECLAHHCLPVLGRLRVCSVLRHSAPTSVCAGAPSKVKKSVRSEVPLGTAASFATVDGDCNS